jgi:EmrB/QacA subfamily drug resistance transporter
MNKFERPDREKAEAATIANAAPARAARPEPITPGEMRVIFTSLMLVMFLAALDQTIVATALPTIGRQFQDVSNLSWVITAYLLASTAVAPVFGTLSDIYGRRIMITLSLVLFIAGSIICALAPSLTVLIIGRGIQGLGGGGILPIVQTIISDLVTPRERGQYQAYFSAVWASAGIGGPILGGVMTDYLHWSVIFWINVPLGVVAMAMLLPKMGRIPVNHRHRKLDWLGGVLLMTSAVVVTLVLTWGGTRFAWLSPTILAMIGAAVIFTLGFIWHARRSSEPFLPLGLMAGSVVPYAMITGGFSIGAMIGLTVHLPLYYEVVYKLPASQAGMALIPLVAISVMGATLAGRAMGHMRHYKWVAMLGTSVSVVALAFMALMLPLPLWLFLTLLGICALGLGTAFPTSTVSIQNAVARHQVGTATGAANFFRSLLSSFAVAAFTAILLAMLGAGVAPREMAHGVDHPIRDIPVADMIAAFRYVLGAAAAMMATAAIAVALMEERPLAGPPESSVMTE